MKRQDKERVVEELRGKFNDYDVAVLTRFTGLKVQELNTLRNDLKKISVEYHVVKNTLVRRAMDGTNMVPLLDRVQGALAIALTRGDIVPTAKLLTEYAKNHPHLQIHAGLIGGKILEQKEVERAAVLPSREELLSKMLFLMNSPLIQLLNVLQAVPAKLVRALGEIQRQKEAGESS